MKGCYLFFLTLLCFMMLLDSPDRVQAKTEKEKIQIKDVTTKIKARKKKLNKVKKKESRVISRLNEIEKQLLNEKKAYKKTTDKTHRIQEEIKKAQIKIKRFQKKSVQREKYLKKRLRALYKYYRRSGFIILLSSGSYNSFLKDEKLLGDVVSKDFDLFNQARKDLNDKQHYRDTLNKERKNLLDAKKNLLSKRRAIEKTRGGKLALLKKIKQQKSVHIKALKELEKHSRELQTFIDQLPKTRKIPVHSKRKFSRRKGRLIYPVRGKIISTFGRHEHPGLHTFTFQKGIEIKAREGTEILAVHDGQIIFADWFKGYGYMIIIDHGESFYSLSAHASKLFKEVGDHVSEGETVALVGDTSSIKGSCLYFEIRHHGKPENPLRWLKKGGNKT